MEPLPEKKSVLIADDEVVNFEYIKIVLMRFDCHLIHATDGLQAVELCQQDPTIKLVLMDLCMPVMDGFAATRKIHEFLPGLPIIALTATWEESLNEALACGCAGAYDKPISKDTLINLVQTYLNKERT